MRSDPAQNYSQHFRNSEGGEPSVEEEEESNSIKETCAHPVTSQYGNNEA